MTAARLVLLGVLALALAGSAGAAVRQQPATAPEGLRAFVLRADEPAARTYARTPSFAWRPVAGATSYEFQLATASTFRDNAIVWSATDLRSPTVAVPLTLPWITGAPYSLHARVRTVIGQRVGRWSAPFGFNMRWGTTPQPLAGSPGLLRWSPVEGATAYQVWLVDVPKIVVATTNVLDHREFYTFHQAAEWTRTVRWRIRAVRDVDGRAANGLPATSFGPWSPIYSSTNPAFASGPLRPLRTVSDVVSAGSSSSAAHRLTPGFVFTGDTTLYGDRAELYRVYAFTDADCLNTVYRGSVVGSPAFAPRPLGPLALPTRWSEIPGARGSYLPDGADPRSATLDGQTVRSNEGLEAATPTVSLPTVAASGSAPGTGTGTGSGGGGGHTFITVSGTTGAPIDMWDTDWPRGGYYWTVVGVRPETPAQIMTSVEATVAAGATTIRVANPRGLTPGVSLLLGTGGNQETVVVTAISGNELTLASGLRYGHAPGEVAVTAGSEIVYRDMELPQEVCAAGRVLRFGKSSEPTVTNAGAPFATGLSAVGRLTSATRQSATFYGHPLIAWAPALGASVYEVQWSRTRYPFRPELDTRTSTRGLLTLSTSAVLPLSPGTWYYRVRGIGYGLPTGAQQMSWSDTARLTVARPTFRVVR